MSPARRLTFLVGAVLATLGLQAGANLLGPAGFLLNLLIPLPAAYVHMRAGSLIGGLAVAASAGLLVGGGWQPALAYLLQFGIGSFALPFLLRRGWRWDRAAALTVVVVLGAAALALGGATLTRDLAVTEAVPEYIGQEVDRALDMYREADFSEEQLAELRRLLEGVAEFMSRAWVGLAGVAAAAAALVMVAGLAVAGRGRYRIPGPAFADWKSPEPFIWGVILGGFGALFAEGVLQTVALNLLTLALPVYFVQGLAVVTHFFRKRQVAPALRGLGYLLIVILNPLPLVVTGIGVFDLWVDFRRPRMKKN